MNTSDRKKERLAEALRENLKKRKIQQHARIKNNLIDTADSGDSLSKEKVSSSEVNEH